MYILIVNLGFSEGTVRGKYSITRRDMPARTRTSSHLILWFGSKWRAEQSFAYNTKRGKKAKGRVPMSEPALSAYKQK